MKLTKLSIRLLSISVALQLSSCAGVPVKDTTIWSYVGNVNGVAAIGSHTNFIQHERMNLDQWIDFLSASEEHGPAICLSSADYTLQKTALEQACYKANCSYEQKKIIADVAARVDKHIRSVQALSKRKH